MFWDKLFFVAKLVKLDFIFRFLNLFEKRNIVFIENGIDLKSQFDGSDEEEEEPVELTKET